MRRSLEADLNQAPDLHLVTLELTSAENLIAKLRRQIERIENAAEREVVADHVNDAFWTAWLVHDWIWDAIKDDQALKAAVLKYRGMDEEKIEDQKSFGIALARRFVPLKICRLVASTPRRRALVVLGTKNVSGGFDIVSAGASSGGTFASDDLTPLVMIMGKPVAATRLLCEIDDYWVTLINESGIHSV